MLHNFTVAFLPVMFCIMAKGNTLCKNMVHWKCRNSVYPKSPVERLRVPDGLVLWENEWSDYDPPVFTAEFIKSQIWADPDIHSEGFKPSWNTKDKHVDRTSYCGPYRVQENVPLNPIGRTGLKGRGVLGRWGPNHAADPIVTRWKRDLSQNIILHNDTQKKVLQFVAIKRKDCGEWAIPGGMVDVGELVSYTLKREFLEETMNLLQKNETEKQNIMEQVKKLFKTGEEVFKGYVDDPRNTDNAWIETVAMHFHDSTGQSVGKLSLTAGDDAVGVRWMDVSKSLPMYASHTDFIEKVAKKLNASW